MTILVDIGNSRTKYCSVEESNTTAFTKITAIDNKLLSEDIFNKHFINTNKIIVANVASDLLTTKLESWCKNNNLVYIEVKSEKKRGNVISAYEQPEQFGIDRWLTLLGAAQLYPDKHVLIIDSGTATTIDLLASSGKHLGGWILPGISTLFNSIHSETVNVNAAVTNVTSLMLGTNTTSNVNNACWAATVGLIEQAIHQSQLQVTRLDEIIITGGNGKVLQQLSSTQMRLIDKLIFYGLNSYN